jgi:hypothetical protein
MSHPPEAFARIPNVPIPASRPSSMPPPDAGANANDVYEDHGTLTRQMVRNQIAHQTYPVASQALASLPPPSQWPLASAPPPPMPGPQAPTPPTRGTQAGSSSALLWIVLAVAVLAAIAAVVVIVVTRG